jgi:hypothetical protein
MTPPTALSTNDVVAAALNEQGFLFQHRIIEELATLNTHGGPAHNWMTEATEVPVSLANETETRIDLILRHQGSGQSPWYGVVECKRAAKDYKRWVFFATSVQRSTPSSESYYVEHGDLLHAWDHQGQAPMSHRVDQSPSPKGHGAFDFYVEARIERPGTGKLVSATTAIEDAFQQVTLGQAGLAQRLRFTNVLKFRLVPIIVTTAEVLVARYNLSKVSLAHGKIEPADLLLEARPWVAVNYRINDVVCAHSGLTTHFSQDIGADVTARQVRTIFVVEAGHLHEFLSWLAHLFGCF